MAIGTVLLQPQKLQRATGLTADQALADDIAELFSRIMTDAAMGGNATAVMAEAMEAVALRLVANAGAGVQAVQTRLAAWVQPLGQQLKTTLGGLTDDPQKIAQTIGQLLGSVATLADGLTADKLRAHLTQGLDVLEKELGLTPTFIEGQIWALFDDVAGRL